jgi:hypothetical protein
VLPSPFIAESERLLCVAAVGNPDADIPTATRSRLGAVSFLHRFGSTLNHHLHLHAWVTDGVFVPAADQAGCDAPPAFLPARPITQVHLAALTERVHRRAVRWFRMQRLVDAAASSASTTTRRQTRSLWLGSPAACATRRGGRSARF